MFPEQHLLTWSSGLVLRKGETVLVNKGPKQEVSPWQYSRVCAWCGRIKKVPWWFSFCSSWQSSSEARSSPRSPPAVRVVHKAARQYLCVLRASFSGTWPLFDATLLTKIALWEMQIVLDSYGCCDKLWLTSWLKQYYFTVLEVRSLTWVWPG